MNLNLIQMVFYFFCAFATAGVFAWFAWSTVPDIREDIARIKHNERRGYNNKHERERFRNDLFALVFFLAEIAFHVWMCVIILKRGGL